MLGTVLKNQWFRFGCCFSGVFLFYFRFGILQETLQTTSYATDKSTFSYTSVIVLIICLFNLLIGVSARKLQGRKVESPFGYYPLMAFSYTAAMYSSNSAIKHVPYVTQVIGKSIKPIVILIFGVIFAKKRHSAKKFMCVALVVIGVILFTYFQKKDTGKQIDSVLIGYALLATSLACDGMTGAIQDRKKAESPMDPVNLMVNINVWAAIYCVFVTLLNGELMGAIDYILVNQVMLKDLVLFGMCSGLGQIFIFWTISDFGPLSCSIVTTTRKFFTVLFSSLILNSGKKPLNSTQWCGVVLVFVGLGLENVLSALQKKKKVKET
ncbi:hypothetical protein SNEBB_007939 [Seison nebaliae]|nr:hypothetical protein SNEBB_007939 [Seison nebaliae]